MRKLGGQAPILEIFFEDFVILNSNDKMNLNMDLVTELQETTPPPPEAIDPITAKMNGYLLEKMAAAGGQAEPKAVETSGSAMHLAIAKEFYRRLKQGNPEESIEAWFNRKWRDLNHFVFQSIPKGKRRKARDKPLKEAIEGMTNGYKNGARGLVTVVYMADASGCEVIFPTPEQDVFKEIDLTLRKKGRTIDLQIKSVQRGDSPYFKRLDRIEKGKVVKKHEGGREVPFIKVVIPGHPEFFRKGSQVFPEKVNCKQFREKLDRLLGLEEK